MPKRLRLNSWKTEVTIYRLGVRDAARDGVNEADARAGQDQDIPAFLRRRLRGRRLRSAASCCAGACAAAQPPAQISAPSSRTKAHEREAGFRVRWFMIFLGGMDLRGRSNRRSAIRSAAVFEPVGRFLADRADALHLGHSLR